MGHRCEKTHHYNKGFRSYPILGICEEDDLGYLHLWMSVERQSSSLVMRVEFCPFYGFKKETNEIRLHDEETRPNHQ